MRNLKFKYFILVLVVISIGILSRKITSIPLYIGDFLYAVMIFFIVRIVYTHSKATKVILISLLICYGIEFFQLYQADWIIALRKTLFGKYVLGQGFLWSDIIAYTCGIAFVFIIEKFTLKYYNYDTSFCLKQPK